MKEYIERLINDYDKFMSYALYITGNNYHLSEDLTQHAFIRAIIHPPEHDDGLISWMQTIIRNIYKKHIKKLKRRNEKYLEDMIFVSALPNSNDVELSDEVKKALEEIEHRNIFYDHEVEGLDYAALSEKYNIGINTVRSRLRRVRNSLRRTLGEYNLKN